VSFRAVWSEALGGRTSDTIGHGDLAGHHPRAHRAAASPRGADPGTLAASVAELEQAIQSWIDIWNQDPRPFVWTKTADEILDTIATYRQRINNSAH
jgi:hypothetical protein